MKILKPVQADALAHKLLKHRERFLGVQRACGVPALWLMPTWAREANDIDDFSCYFGNGDPLDRPTVDVPAGRGPFDSWEDGCVDALHLDHVTDVHRWPWEMACWEWEKFNGFGPRIYHARPTGYLWSGTDQYQGGKYDRDGHWSRGTWDRQLGTVIVAKAIVGLDPEIAQGFVS